MSGSHTAPANIQPAPPRVVSAPTRAPRLLVVSYHFPPGEGVGALRWAGLTKYLARAGWEIRVVSAFGPERREHERSVTVLGRPPRRTLNDRYVEWRRSKAKVAKNDGPRKDPATGSPVLPDDEGSEKGRARELLRELGGLLSWPDEGRGWIAPAAKATRETIRSFSPDVVVSSGPPHSVHMAARLGLGRSGIPWFMDMRDPWAQQEQFTRLVRSTFRWLEARAVRGASGLIVTTPELRDVLADDYPDTPVHWVPNGVDLDLFPEPEAPPFPGLSVLHLGSIYSGRDPSPVLEAFARFLDACPEAREAGSVLRFVGNVEARHRTTIEQAASSRLQGRVELISQLPRDEALTFLQRSALSVVLAQRQWEMVPAKLYESVALGLPTLVIAEVGSATYEAAGRVGALRAEPDDIDAIVERFLDVWKGEPARTTEADVPLEYGELAHVIGRLLRS